MRRDDIADYIEQLGSNNIIDILPVAYEYTQDTLTTYSGRRGDTVGSIIIEKYLIIYK